MNAPARTSRLGARLCCVVALALGMALPSAAEASFTATLDIKNSDPLSSGNFGTVTVDDSVANQVTITFAFNPNINNGTDLFQKVAFNTDFDLGAAGVTVTVPTNWNFSFDPNNNTMDGFGKFDVVVSTNGEANRINTVTIIIEATGITADDFLFTSIGGNAGQSPAFFSAHYVPGESGGFTYFVGTTSLPPDELNPTPAPPSAILALLGIAVAGFGYQFRRRRTALSC